MVPPSQEYELTKPRIGLIARDDAGGIAAQSIDFAKHLTPEATLVIQLGDKGRGHTTYNKWPNPLYLQTAFGSKSWLTDSAVVSHFVNQVDVILTIETFYGPLVHEVAQRAGTKTVRYVNPELYRPELCDQEVLPSEWETHRFPQAEIILQGVDAPKRNIKLRSDLKTVLHQAAPAMLDRNGTNIFLDALSLTTYPLKVIIHGPLDGIQKHMINQLTNKHDIHVMHGQKENRWDIYQTDIDLLIYPRRYGGNSLTLLEAAACGIPILTTNCPPQNQWLKTDSMLHVEHVKSQQFIGGKYQIYNTNPQQLATNIDKLYENPLKLQQLSYDSLQFSAMRSWNIITPQWHHLFNQLTK